MNTVSDLLDREDSIGPSTLRRLAEAWPRRATVRTDLDAVHGRAEYDDTVPDYPVQFLPFAEHPDFLDATDEQRQLVLTLAWLVYNERVITAEEYVANPTFAKIVHGDYPGIDRFEIQQTVQQAHVDETWHTYMHMLAMRNTRLLRRVDREPDYPHTVTYRRLLAEHERVTETWQRDLLTFVWATVAEVSVNAYLELMSRDETIQPAHSLVTRLHARDESAHGPVMVEVGRELHAHLDRRQREFFNRAIPLALEAFVVQDFDVWPIVIRHAGIRNAVDIVEDCRRLPGNSLLVRDFSGVRRLAHEVGAETEFEVGR
ncbi:MULTISPECIES: diiron oxygenase [unclassified Plantactinospora]|uniref:diiron oxygenase n=1 Tax=unclassified Plantactinospora TaxID=2631981 RepID=UPI000D159F6F|nr:MULTISPECIES: diiron oxygenase [unclassified Plantactinospora]AVT28464.1 hypothetical protein C6361_01940 [Plantactinospora sp. BC1]AVT38299.1 hypothetical protein C6W10_19730 [Plantactinospora sp. BB1]